MAAFAKNEPPSVRALQIHRATELLGGKDVFPHSLDDALDVHEMLQRGLSSTALTHLIDNLSVIPQTAVLEKVVGMSLRTFQRRKDSPSKPLNQTQSGRVWTFAMILAKATAIFGSQAKRNSGWDSQQVA